MIPRDVLHRRLERRPAARAARDCLPWLAVVLVGATACGPAVKRDLSGVPVGRVGFDDLCGLQNYFDAIAMNSATPPSVIDAADIERVSDAHTARGGRARFAFETDFQLATVRRVLGENWTRLPENLGAARHVEINVNWSERGSLRRVANDSNPELVVDGVVVSLPYHICLSELLFGEPLYRQRRDMLGLAPLPTAHPLALPPEAAPDAGAPAPDGPIAVDPRGGAGNDTAVVAKPSTPGKL